MALADRSYRIVVGTTEIDAVAGVGPSSLRVQFAVERDLGRAPNQVDVVVHNLNLDHRSMLEASDRIPVSIEAGYLDNLGVIFLGDLRSAVTRRQGGTQLTHVSGGDGENALQTARVNKTYLAGTPVREVVRDIGRQLGVQPGNLNTFGPIAFLNGADRLEGPYTASGLCFDELQRICESVGARYSVQDSALQLHADGEPINQQQGLLLTEASGLVGEPEVQTEKGKVLVTVTSLLQPDLVPGKLFRVESEKISANLVTEHTVHRGDSHGRDWYVVATGRVYDA